MEEKKNNLRIYEYAKNPPEEAKKPINGGRLKGMTDINPMWRIKTLTELFGPVGIGWYYTVDRQWTETVGDEVAGFVNISLYIKVDGEWSKPIFGNGGSRLATMDRSGKYVSDEVFKMATTDALSVACKQLGFAADVYWSKDATKYNYPGDEFITEKELKVLEELCKKIGKEPKEVFNYWPKLTPDQYAIGAQTLNAMIEHKKEKKEAK